MSVRPIAVDDLDMVLSWRNCDAVRRNMASTHVIRSEEHRDWFKRIRADPTCRWLIVSDSNRPMGVGYITDIDAESRTAQWGFYKAPDMPPGTGTRVCIETLDYAFRELPIDVINGDVRDTNVLSVRIHEKLGFTRMPSEPSRDLNEFRCCMIRFGLSRQAWESTVNRERIVHETG